MKSNSAVHTDENGARLSELLRTGMSLALALAAASTVFALGSASLIITRAVNPAESNAMAVIISLYPLYLGAGSLCAILFVFPALVSAARLFRKGKRARSGAVAASGVLAAVALFPVVRGFVLGYGVEAMPMAGSLTGRVSVIAIAAAVLLWTASRIADQLDRGASAGYSAADSRIARILGDIGPARFAATLPSFGLIAGLAGAAVSAIEIALHTLRVVGDYNIHVGLGSYWLTCLSAAMLSGIAGSLVFALLLAGPILAATFRKKLSLGGGSVTVILGLTAGALLYLFAWFGAAAVFYDELARLEMVLLVKAMFLMLGAYYGLTTAGNLQEFARAEGRPARFADLVRIYILSAVLVPAGAICRAIGCKLYPGKAAIAGVFAVLLALSVLLIYQSFPSLYDVTSGAVIVWAAGLTFSAVAIGYLVFPPRSSFWKVQAAVLAVLLGVAFYSLFRWGPTTPVRLLIFEYSSISRANVMAIETVLPIKNRPLEDVEPTAPPDAQGPQPTDTEAFYNLREKRPFTIYVVFDAARPDHLSFYGYERPTTPNLDRYRDMFVRFDNAITQATATTCAMRHFFTGCYSSRYMLKTEGNAPFFTNDLISAGYDEFFLNIIGSDYNGISCEAFLRDMPPEMLARVRYSCYEEGYEVDSIATLVEKRTGGLGLPDEPAVNFVSCTDQNEIEKVKTFLGFVDSLPEDNGAIDASGVFAYIHMTASHFPWVFREEGERFGDTETDMYDHNIAFCDAAMGKLLDGLASRGLLDGSIFIFSADHGTGLAEHGRYGGFNPYIEQINVPLLVHVPGVPARIEKSLVALFDVGPTLVAPFFPERLNRFHGISLWPLLIGGHAHPERAVFSLNSFDDSYSLVKPDGTHYIYQREHAYEILFNCRDDRGETLLLQGADWEEPAAKCRAHMKWFLENTPYGHDNPYHYREIKPK